MHRGGWSGVVESHDSGGLKHVNMLHILPNGPICALDTTKVPISIDNITSQSSGNLQSGDFSLKPAEPSEHSWNSDMR